MYDFNLVVGDSLLFDPYFAEYAHVTNVDSVLIAGSYRKRIYFDNPPDVWVEGFGSMYNTFEPLSYFSVPVYGELLCVTDSTGNLYQNPSYNSCWVNTTIIIGTNEKTISTSRIMIFPNPASSHITIEAPMHGQISILNLQGQELINSQITEQKTTVDISTLPSGVYLLKVTGERAVQVGKFVKQ